MYCPTCGAENTTGLNYCKRCGANLHLSASKLESYLPKMSGAFWAIAVFGIASLGMLFSSLTALAMIGFNKEGVLVPMIIFGSLTIFGIAILLIRQMSRLIGLAQVSKASAKEPCSQLYIARTMIAGSAVSSDESHSQPPPGPDALPSITEHTTRKFEQPQYEGTARRTK
jgi:hypothetical protein